MASKDFYFDKELYDISIDAYYCLAVKHTEWFKKYVKLFKKSLESKSVEALKENENFKVSFVLNFKFVLELI